MADQTGPKRTRRQREFDLQEISSLYLQGWIQAAIADHLAKNRSYKVSQQTISADIKTIQKRWLDSSLVDYDQAKAKELAAIDHLERVAWEAYDLSKDPIVKRKTAKKVDGETTEATQEVSLGYGDAKFLDKVSWCIDRRIKLLGLDAPTGMNVTWQDKLPEGVDPDDVKRRLAKMLAAKAIVKQDGDDDPD